VGNFREEPACGGVLPDAASGQDFNCVQMRESGYNNHYELVLGAGAKVEDPPTGGNEIPPWRGKNRDKQLTHIVRVMVWRFV
jgi:hypothetical protein